MVAIGPDGSPLNLGALSELLQELRIDNVTIAEILSTLDEGVGEIQSFEPSQVPERRFGTLPNGQQLGHHTELARRAVRESILTMVSDLQHYNDGVETFRKGFNVADEHAREDIDHIAMEVSSVQSDSTEGWDK